LIGELFGGIKGGANLKSDHQFSLFIYSVMKVFLLIFALIGGAFSQCTPSVTRVVGTQAPAQVCSGQIIFEDDFNTIDRNKWFFENTLAGGGNWEFQWYPGYDSTNCFVRNGNLHLAPTFTSDIFGEDFLTSGRVQIPPAQCTQADWYGCDRQGTPDNIINPTRSTRVDTRQSFGFVYGELEIRARAPAGDW
jgi:beta-glucanase (GH16 family)